MKYSKEILDERIVKISLEGDMDHSGTEDVAVELLTIGSSDQNLILEFSGVGFITSMGIRTLLTTAKSLKRHGGTMVILNPLPRVLGILEQTGTTDLIPVCDSLEIALGLCGA